MSLAARPSATISRFVSSGFSGSDDELPFARDISERLGTNHTERTLSPDYMSQRLDDILVNDGHVLVTSPVEYRTGLRQLKYTVSDLTGDSMEALWPIEARGRW